MNINIVTHNYPTTTQPYLQPFIRDQVNIIRRMQVYQPKVIVPSPLFIPFTDRWYNSKSPLLDSEIAQRFKYLSIPKRIAPKLTGRNLAKNLIAQLNNPDDIIHVHWLYPNGLALPYLKSAGFNCVLNIHGTDWYSVKDDNRFSTLIEEVFNSADVIVVSGKKIKDEILKRFPELDVRISFNYINLDLFQFPDKKLKLRAQKRLNFDPLKTHILTVANIRPEKGIDILLDAISNIEQKNVCFHIIGQLGSGTFSSSIETKLKSLPADLVEIHQPVSRKSMPSYYFASDAYLLPSRSEGFNVSLLEALATGLPVIATDTGGAGKVLDDRRGILVKPNDSDTLANAIEKLLSARPLKRSLESRTYIENNFSFKHYSEFLKALYSSIQKKTSNTSIKD